MLVSLPQFADPASFRSHLIIGHAETDENYANTFELMGRVLLEVSQLEGAVGPHRILLVMDGKMRTIVMGLKGPTAKHPCSWCKIPKGELNCHPRIWRKKLADDHSFWRSPLLREDLCCSAQPPIVVLRHILHFIIPPLHGAITPFANRWYPLLVSESEKEEVEVKTLLGTVGIRVSPHYGGMWTGGGVALFHKHRDVLLRKILPPGKVYKFAGLMDRLSILMEMTVRVHRLTKPTDFDCAADNLYEYATRHYPAFSWTPLLHSLLCHGSAFIENVGPLGRLSDEPLEYFHAYFGRMVDRSWGHRDISGAMQSANLVHHPKVRDYADEFGISTRAGHHFVGGRSSNLGEMIAMPFLPYGDFEDGEPPPVIERCQKREAMLPVELLAVRDEELVSDGDEEGEAAVLPNQRPEQPGVVERRGRRRNHHTDPPRNNQVCLVRQDGGALRLFRRYGYLRHFIRGDDRAREYSGCYFRWNGARFEQQLLFEDAVDIDMIWGDEEVVAVRLYRGTVAKPSVELLERLHVDTATLYLIPQ